MLVDYSINISDIIPKLPKSILLDIKEMEESWEKNGNDWDPAFDVFDAHVKQAELGGAINDEELDRLFRRYGYR